MTPLTISSTRMEKNIGQLSEESFTFKEVTWKIPNFLGLPSTIDYYVTSPAFCFANAIWCLQLYTNGQYSNKIPNYIGAYVVRLHSSVPVHHLRYKFGFKTRRGRECGGMELEETLANHNNKSGFGEYFDRQNILNQKQSLLPNEILTLFCQMRVKEEATLDAPSRSQQHQNERSQTELQEASSQTDVPRSVTQREVEEASSQTDVTRSVTQRDVEEASSQTDVPRSVTQRDVEEASTSVQKLQLDYNKLLKSEEDSDVCLKVSNKEFRAHRCILRARSAVFSAMFKYETEENATGEVVIDDLDPDSFPDFLKHVYAGQVETLSDENVFHLYSAADKYDMQELKSECREYMKRTLSVDTYCDVLVLALRHKEDELLKMAIDYFASNFAEIVVTVNWQSFLIENPNEANELFIKALVPGKKK